MQVFSCPSLTKGCPALQRWKPRERAPAVSVTLACYSKELEVIWKSELIISFRKIFLNKLKEPLEERKQASNSVMTFHFWP